MIKEELIHNYNILGIKISTYNNPRDDFLIKILNENLEKYLVCDKTSLDYIILFDKIIGIIHLLYEKGIICKSDYINLLIKLLI
jgi:hypothetical protein